MDLGIDGKVALVTGASKGLGLGIARTLAHEGATVALASRSADRIEAAAREIPGARGFVHDTSDVDAAPALVRKVRDELGSLDILVVSTGGPLAFNDPLAPTLAQWRMAYESLLLGTIALVQAAVPAMRDQGWGRVVSVSSFVAREPPSHLVLSSAHRAGQLAALKTFAGQLAPHGVTVNTVLPGRVATDRLVENFGSLEAASEAASKDTPAGRLGTVDELAAAVAFLCSAPAAYVTGTTLVVDGGLSRAI
jgi:3-oxoacyl-[acyl-carrier protein] reductase